MRLSVHYATSYLYSQPAGRVVQQMRVTPLSFAGQSVIDWRIDVNCDARLREGRDGYGNVVHMLYLDQPVQGLTVTVSGKVLTEDRAGVVDGLPGELPPPIFLRQTPLTAPHEQTASLARHIDEAGGAPLDKLHRLTARLHETMRFDPGATVTGTTACEALAAGHGVCQDFAHIFLSVARLLDIPSRYISGHLFRRDGRTLQQAAHAWVEAWVEDLGWVAFDPANGISTDDAYIRVACGLDYIDAAPFAGTRNGGGTEQLSVSVEVSLARSQSQSQSQSQN